MACKGCLEKRAGLLDMVGLKSNRAVDALFQEFAESAMNFPSSHVSEAASMLIATSMKLTHKNLDDANKNVDMICAHIKQAIRSVYQDDGKRRTLIT